MPSEIEYYLKNKGYPMLRKRAFSPESALREGLPIYDF